MPKRHKMDIFEIPGSGVMLKVHTKKRCRGDWCVIHKPMNTYPRTRLHWRGDRGIFEVICAHGVGHPAPEQLQFWRDTNREYESIHGCCMAGCCASWDADDTR